MSRGGCCNRCCSSLLWRVLWRSSFTCSPAIRLIATTLRITRSALLEVLGADYVRTARAKGLREPVVLQRHALKNALLPVIAVIGVQLGSLIGGSVIVEFIFNWPGVGSY